MRAGHIHCTRAGHIHCTCDSAQFVVNKQLHISAFACPDCTDVLELKYDTFDDYWSSNSAAVVNDVTINSDEVKSSLTATPRSSRTTIEFPPNTTAFFVFSLNSVPGSQPTMM